LGVSNLDLFSVTPPEVADLLPRRFRDWFASRGWSPRDHQLALLAKAREERSALLIAPTGAGKTLAGFLPSLTDLTRRGKIPPGSAFTGIHTLYISPLKVMTYLPLSECIG